METVARRRRAALALLAAGAALACGAFAPAGDSPAAGGTAETFHALLDEATARMHAAMHAPRTGDPDRDFALAMIPHHQGAIDMALAQLRFGTDRRLRRLAQEIIVEQREEIAAMRAALADLGTPRDAAAAGAPAAHHPH